MYQLVPLTAEVDGYFCINLYAHATPLSAQIADRHVHKDLCNKTVRSRIPTDTNAARRYKSVLTMEL